MNQPRSRRFSLVPALFAAVLSAPVLAQGPDAEATLPRVGAFRVHFDAAAFPEPFSGTAFVAFGHPDDRAEPRAQMHRWFSPPPVLRFELEDVAPGTTLALDVNDAARRHPSDWGEVPAVAWELQAVVRRSPSGREAGLSPGDVFGAPVRAIWDPAATSSLELALDTVVEPQPFLEEGEEGGRLRLFELESEVLSAFHGFPYTLRAGVLLPPDHAREAVWPVVYSITGFGGTHASVRGWERRAPPGSPLAQAVVVVPDATNRYGHSVFCDSSSIGPWGEALVTELLPAIDAAFAGAGPKHRYVTGVSSGGWSSLWLQVRYPEAFAGCWSHVPDPIDFHDFQGIDLYEPLPDGSPRNMYVDEHGEPRPLARFGGQVTLTYEAFVRREHVLNPGGQIRSFEATFSPPGPDGTPRRVFDVETGAIDHAAARAWRPYDISHRLLGGWEELRPRLAGKIHVYAGEVDTFYLEGAVERFRAFAQEAGLLEDMVVEVVPGMAHQLHGPGHEHMLATMLERWRSVPVE